MCQDCAQETAFEADQRYATAGKFDRHNDPRTSAWADQPQKDRIIAELKAGIYDTYPAEQKQAVTEFVLEYLQGDGISRETYVRKYARQTETKVNLGIIYRPMNDTESACIAMRAIHGFTVMSDEDYSNKVRARLAEEEATAAVQATFGSLLHATGAPADESATPAARNLVHA